MMLRIVFAVLLMLAPAMSHASIAQSSAVTSGVQASGSTGALASNRYLLSTDDELDAASRTLLAKKKSKKPAKKPSKKPIKKPSPPPKRPSSPAKKPAPKPSPKPIVKPTPPVRPAVVPSPPPPSPPPPSPPPPSPSPPPPPPPCPLSIGGASTSFQKCDSTTWSDVGTIYFSLQGETLTLGFKGAAATQGWVGIDLTPDGKMANSDAIVARTNLTDSTINPLVVHINGYNPGTFAPTTVYSNVAVGKEGGVLVGTGTVNWPSSSSTLSLAFTAGNMNPNTGNVGKHYKTPVIKTLNRATLTVT